MRFLLFLLSLGMSISLFSKPTTITLPEKEYYQYIQSVRAKKFSDREIDRIHLSLAKMLERINQFKENGTIGKSSKYNSHLPDSEPIYFLKDKDGKDYFSLFIGQGVTHEDYPVSRIFNTKVYIYPSEDKKSLSKVIIQYVRVNTDGPVYVKEMRRIINDKPEIPGPPKLEGEKVEGDIPKFQEEITTDPTIAAKENNEILVEYYSGHDELLPWVEETPTPENKASITSKLYDEADLLPFDMQKKIYISYRDVLRELDSKIKKRLELIELDQRTTIRKIADFN
jgi:hypothetical protein